MAILRLSRIVSVFALVGFSACNTQSDVNTEDSDILAAAPNAASHNEGVIHNSKHIKAIQMLLKVSQSGKWDKATVDALSVWQGRNNFRPANGKLTKSNIWSFASLLRTNFISSGSTAPLLTALEFVTFYMSTVPSGQLRTRDGTPVTFTGSIRVPGGYVLPVGAQELQSKSGSYNCHGFVFLGGAGNLSATELTSIVFPKNGYQKTSNPQVGDVIIYKKNGAIEHSGIVVSTAGSSRTIISKFGPNQLVQHDSLAVPASYGTTIEYYRTDKNRSHLLSYTGN